MRYKVKSCNACGAGILPARYVPHNIGKCCMSSQQFQSAHSSIHKLGTRLLKYLEEIRQSRYL
ncbi:MAG: hypothetical protein ACKO8W_11815 [Dolichospermum sp.]